MEYLRVGLIVRPHGVHGAVKMMPLSDDLRRYAKLKEAYLERDGHYEPVTVSDVGVKEDAVYASLSCSHSRDDAEMLRNVYLCVDRAHAVKLPKGRYFVVDLIGCEVFDTDGACYGKLQQVLETGANDVYVIKGEKTLLIPALKKLLTDVDVNAKRILLDADVLKEVGLFED
ncbi:MAG: 16S rRNA processing protein RimM [Clostridiales bacterium]|nr:16S rRNA processing protein RimM [Clostridiales bacterium]